MKVKIVTDSTADLPPEICRELDITVIPLKVRFGEKVYEDGVDLSNTAFYDMLDKIPLSPQTSAQSPGVFGATYNRIAQKTDSILSIHIAASLSATMESARIGSQTVDVRVELVDSGSASMGAWPVDDHCRQSCYRRRIRQGYQDDPG